MLLCLLLHAQYIELLVIAIVNKQVTHTHTPLFRLPSHPISNNKECMLNLLIFAVDNAGPVNCGVPMIFTSRTPKCDT